MRTLPVSTAIAFGIIVFMAVLLDRWFWLMRRTRKIVGRYLFTDDGLVPAVILVAHMCVVSGAVYVGTETWLRWIHA